MRRMLVGGTATVCLLASVVGCAADPSDDAPVDTEQVDTGPAALEDDADAAREGVVGDIVAALEVDFISGTRRFNFCGETYAPRGVMLDEHLLFAPSPLGTNDAVEAVARVLLEQGWAVERPPNPHYVIGILGEIEVTALVGPAAVQFDIENPDCVETDDDVARSFAERPNEDVGWDVSPEE